MSGFCVEGQASSDFYAFCCLCHLDLQGLSANEKEAHLNLCLNEMEKRETNDSTDNAASAAVNSIENELDSEASEDISEFQSIISGVDSSYSGLRAEKFACIVCDLDLSRRQVTSRCQHLKRCSKQNGIGIRDLLQMLSPNHSRDYSPVADVPSNSRNVESCLGKRSSPENAFKKLMEASKTKSYLDKKNLTLEPTSATSVLMASAKLKWGKGSEKKSANGGKSRNGIRAMPSATTNRDRYCPDYKKVLHGSHMTKPIIVDGFHYASSDLSDCYFLSHFHSDHYGGLSKHFDCGTVYCSPATCSLVKLKLNVSSQYLRPLELDKKHTVMCNGVPVQVTLTDANHCPGAVLILFQFPLSGAQDGRSGVKSILHTGDFRFTRSMLESSRILNQLARTQSSNSKNLVVYLDTTYCNPSHCFPPQSEAIEAVKQCVLHDIASMKTNAETSRSFGLSSPETAGVSLTSPDNSTLYVFGAYGIGKERVFMSVAQMLDKKIYVEKSKWKMMLCFDWPANELSRLTPTNPDSTNIWVVPMGQINFKALDGLRVKRKGCKRVVAFQPTGWTHTREKSSKGNGELRNNSLIKSRYKDGNVIHSVAYSEHSSFDELVQFVSIFRPHQIIPTVNTSKDKVKEQINHLRNGVKEMSEVSSKEDFATTTHSPEKEQYCATSLSSAYNEFV